MEDDKNIYTHSEKKNVYYYTENDVLFAVIRQKKHPELTFYSGHEVGKIISYFAEGCIKISKKNKVYSTLKLKNMHCVDEEIMEFMFDTSYHLMSSELIA